jgi:hypothetical protein
MYSPLLLQMGIETDLAMDEICLSFESLIFENVFEHASDFLASPTDT